MSLLVFLLVIWVIIPAPDYRIWLYSVAASEWSLWLGGFSLIIIGLSVYTAVFGGNGRLWILSIVFSSVAFLISICPFFSSRNVAEKHRVSLSVGEYFTGLVGDKTDASEFSTHTYANADGQDLRLDVYKPQVNNENNGASIIVIHGGSWNAGVRNDFPQWNRWLAANGFTVFDIDYRIAPQPNYKTATGDVKCAVRWAKANAAKFGIDPDKIALFGRSAGGHLALLAAYSANNPELPASCLETDQDESVAAVISFYAPIDLLWAYDNHANEFVINGPETLSAFLGGDPHSSDEVRKRYELASPLTHFSHFSPPTILFHGGKDQLVRIENMKFLNRERIDHLVPGGAVFIPYAQHGFDYNIRGWGSQIAKPLILKFLKENTRAK